MRHTPLNPSAPSGHDHVGHMVRSRYWQLCDPDTGGCGQRWQVIYGDPDLYGRRRPIWLRPQGRLVPTGQDPF